jgi:hypothetical protein
MNEIKLSDSIQRFHDFILKNPKFYNDDERGRKEEVSNEFAHIFSQSNVLGNNFSTSLLDLFSDNKVTKVVIWLSGGSFYQCQRFIDLLSVRPGNEVVKTL